MAECIVQVARSFLIKAKCVTKQHYNKVRIAPKMPRPANLLLRYKKTCLIGTESNKSHVIRILVAFFQQNESCDVKMMPLIMNRVSMTISKHNLNMIFVAISCRHFELTPCTEAVSLPQRLCLLHINPGIESDLCPFAAFHPPHPITYHSFSC